MLPKAVLSPPPRGGKRNQRSSASFTADKLTRWLEGDRLRLWEESCTAQAPHRKGADSAADRLRKADMYSREGFDHKACSALTADEVCQPTAANAREVRRLHPQASAPNCPLMSDLPMAARITQEMVSDALKSFPKDSAPGPSGLRVQHILESLTPAQRDAVTEQLTAVAQLLANGDAPSDVAPHVAGASLMALVKPNGSLRPIAMGEVLRRITGKCLCSAVKEEAQQYFKPVQVGVATKLGIDGAVHAVRRWRDWNLGRQDKVLLKIDFENAFNCVNREKALSVTRSQFPSLARFSQWCYAHPSRLLFGKHVVKSAVGVQQGDPLGPLLFSAAIHSLATDLSEMRVNGVKLDLLAFYLDDGVCAGDIEVVAEALRRIQAQAAELGLKLNLGKCELITEAPSAPVILHRHFPREVLLDLKSGASRVATSGNFELLGSAIGDALFCEQFAKGRVAKAKKLLKLLPDLAGP